MIYTCPYCGEMLESSGFSAWKTECTGCKRKLLAGIAFYVPPHGISGPPQPIVFNQARDKVLYAGKWYKLVEDEE